MDAADQRMDRWTAAHGGGAVPAEGGNGVRDGQAGADDSPPDFKFHFFQGGMGHDDGDVLGQDAAENADEPRRARALHVILQVKSEMTRACRKTR